MHQTVRPWEVGIYGFSCSRQDLQMSDLRFVSSFFFLAASAPASVMSLSHPPSHSRVIVIQSTLRVETLSRDPSASLSRSTFPSLILTPVGGSLSFTPGCCGAFIQNSSSSTFSIPPSSTRNNTSRKFEPKANNPV